MIMQREIFNKAEKIKELKEAIAKLNTNDFGINPGVPEEGETNTLTREFPKCPAGAPHAYPKAGEHPRVLFNKNDVPAIKSRISDCEGMEEYKQLMQYLEEDLTGILPPPEQNKRGFHNWNGEMLSRIQANALGYAVYGEELYGYKAILGIENFLLTLDVDYIFSDQCREFGMVMYIAACVYDWCYPLLSEEDKIRIPLGVEHRLCRGYVKNTHKGILTTSQPIRMEMHFPPASQFPGSGHGAEFQLQRDYLAMAIAVYDEMPSWYEMIAGRFYNEYIPIYGAYAKAGMYPQGMSCYAPWRFLAVCFGGALIQAATGKSPYDTGIANIVFTFLANETAENKIFSTGDGSSVVLPQSAIKNEALVISHMLYDTPAAPILRLVERNLAGNYLGIWVSTVTMSEYFVFTARKVEELPNESWREVLPAISYTGDYIGQYLTRNKWGNDGAVTMMRMACRSTGNHDHKDSGTFQIYYKGATSGSSGSYGTYGSNHWRYYHQSTVGHNGILIFDPSLADTVGELVLGDDGNPKIDSYKNVAYHNKERLFYSGDQKGAPHVLTYDTWMTDEYKRAEVTGHSSAYAKDGKTPKYSYIAGDITYAYESSQASYVGRSMLTAFTDNAKAPMALFVFDRIDAADEAFVKKFLFQVNGVNAPEIDEERLAVVVNEGNGQLVLQNVKGGKKIEGLGGGYGSNYIINGVNCADNSFGKQDAWGRVEISTTGSKSETMLNVIYAFDAGNPDMIKAKSVSGFDKKNGEKIFDGATLGNITALFSAETKRSSAAFSFTAEGDGTMTYYVGGISAGKWQISIDGNPYETVISTDDAGMVTFEAPAGKEITLNII